MGSAAGYGETVTEPIRVVTDSMLGMRMPDVAVLSPRVAVVLGQNPGLFTGPGTNTYLIGTGSRPFLLDTGQGAPRYVDLLADVLRRTRPADGLHAVVATHAHLDHIGGLSTILNAFGSVPLLKMPWPGHDPAAVDVGALADGDEIAVAGATLRAIWTPGHSRDHLCYYLREDRALFTGDVVLGAGTTVIPDDGDLGDYLASLRRLLEIDMDVIHPAHGPSIHSPHQKITEYLAHRDLRERQIVACLRDGIRHVPRIVERIYTDVPAVLHFAAGMSVTAHLRKLEQDEIARRAGDEWVLR